MRDYFINELTNGGPVKMAITIIIIYFFVFLVFAIGKRIMYNTHKGK